MDSEKVTIKIGDETLGKVRDDGKVIWSHWILDRAFACLEKKNKEETHGDAPRES